MADRITLAFYRAPGNGFDRLIRFWTSSIYSHVELVGGQGTDEQGDWFAGYSSSPRDGGVRRAIIRVQDGHWDFVTIPGDSEKAEAFIRDRIGARYDWLGAIGGAGFRLPIGGRRRWFCSEIVAHAIGRPDLGGLDPGQLHQKITTTPAASGRLFRARKDST